MTPLSFLVRILSKEPHLTSIQIGILLAIQDERKTLPELSAMLTRHITSIGNNVNILVELNYARKIPNLNNLRTFLVSHTQEGQALIDWSMEDPTS